jgi:hypothetical protein
MSLVLEEIWKQRQACAVRGVSAALSRGEDAGAELCQSELPHVGDE